MFSPAAPAAEITLEIIVVLTAGASVIFVLMMVLTWLTLRANKSPLLKEQRQLWIVGGGFAFPVVVLSALLGYSTWRSAQLMSQAHEGIVISVTGVQWWWDVRYRDPATGLEVRTANEIRVPVGQPVTLGLATTDVIHSFWVPALAGKVDMVPGRVHQLRIQASKPGVYRGQCAEYCGDQHAKMAVHVVAVTPEEFRTWLAAQAAPASTTSDKLGERGQRLFTELRCTACHAVRGIAGASDLGPDLTHVASRLYIGAGTLPTQTENFRRWVEHVQRVKPGARMPAYGELDGASLDALAAFLGGLK
jgi:cytochrome c oxidase subunit 2